MLNWEKKGLIFRPNDYSWDKRFVGFAQSPQALEFNNYVRVYFSIRCMDERGKYISEIRYVDFCKSFKNVLNISYHEVLGPGEVGCFDEHGVFPINVLRVGSEIYGYTNGWSRRISTPVETGIGLVISKDDGKKFIRYGNGPVLSATLNEPFLVGDGFVRKMENQFVMWYIYGTNWKFYDSSNVPERTYKIGMAKSLDGIYWEKFGKQLIPDILGPDECQALPSVLIKNNTYHMVFCYRQPFGFRDNPLCSYRLGYAISNDGENWTRKDECFGLVRSGDGWDSQMMCYPHLFEINGSIFLLYNGNSFGRDGFGLASLASGI